VNKKRVVLGVTIGVTALLAMAGVAGATALGGQDPQQAPQSIPGNNQTVKLHEGAGEPSPEIKDETHVCTFHVHAFGFDSGQTLTFTVLAWPPTGNGELVLSGTIQTDSTGEGRSPVSGSYSLPDGHYRLVVDTGNATHTQDKHKEFWVSCVASTSPPPPTTTPPPPTTTPPPPTTTPPPPTTTPPPPTTTPPPPTTTPPVTTSPAVALSTTPPTPPSAPPAVAPELARTGSSMTLPAFGLGLVLVVSGLILSLVVRRPRN
jgi:hypothetical protein